MRGRTIDAVVVVVPVHDESELLGRCLSALEVAVAKVERPCVVRVVLDACSDDSAAVASRFPFPVLHIDANAVGSARALGIGSALEDLRRIPSDGIWIANTDGDSVVPPEWLTVQCALADAGADLVLGTVRPDFRDLTEAHRDLWLRTHQKGAPAGNTHGANLGIRSSAYASVGGFADVTAHEDVRLVEECRARGARIVVTDDAEVMTSGRAEGRAPGGYAAFIRQTAARLTRESAILDQEKEPV